MTGNVFILQVPALMYVVLSKEEKLAPYGKLVDTTEYMTVQARCRTEVVKTEFNFTYIISC